VTFPPINDTDAGYLAVAARLAKRGLGRTSPNPSVGALVVDPRCGGEIVSRGWTQPGGRPHAEQVALERAGDRARGATMYVTLEPCAHQGKSPPCADALIGAGIARLVCAMGDPDPRVSGEGFERLRQAGIEVALAGEPGEAAWLVHGHVLRQRAKRPFVQLKLAAGADGRLPAANGSDRPVWVTGERARARGHLMRAQADAIIVGSGTALADDPELTCRLPGLEDSSPLRVVFDSKLRLAPASRLVASLDRAPLWVLCGEGAQPARREALERKGVRLIAVEGGVDGRIDLGQALERLAGEGVTRALVEGGPTLARACLAAGLIDEAVFFTGREAVGEGGLLPFVEEGFEGLTESGDFEPVAARPIGPDRMAVYRRRA